MACREGCKTKDHATYGECLKSARAGVIWGAAQRRNTEKELQSYRDARKSGVQPSGTTHKSIDAANAISDKYGAAFNAEDGTVGGTAPAIIDYGKAGA